jgi:HSP20 family protein
MNRLIDEAFGGLERPGAGTETFTPRLDVSETDEAVQVRIEVPGLDPKDLDVSLTDDVLVVRGEKRRQESGKDQRWHRVETHYGAFERALRLPMEVQSDKVTASHDKGVVTITLPKAPSARGTTRRIDVTS